MNVLSLFDGMSCGMIALDRLGIKVDNYYASEIDKYAIQVSQANYPDIIQLGDVTNWQEWDIDWATIDLVTGGFPCQSWSLAGKQLGDKDERGMLFWVMLDIMQKVMENNPNAYYLMENVKMKKEFEEYITMHTQNALPNVYKYFINSSLVSAQSRQRYYWTNIPNVEQPEERGIVLRDILEDQPQDPTLMSDKFVARNGDRNCMIDKTKEKAHNLSAMEYVKNGRQGNYLACDENGVPKHKPVKQTERNRRHLKQLDDKSLCMTATMYKGAGTTGMTLVPQRVGTHVEQVKVRKHEVDITALQYLLREMKAESKKTNRQIAEETNLPITKVEHWFRTDSSFAIPSDDVWLKLKEVLGIQTEVFDKPIMEFEYRDGVYESTQRVYGDHGKSPTLTASNSDQLIQTSDKPQHIGTAVDVNGHDILKRVYSPDGKSPTLNTCGGGNTHAKVVCGAWRGRYNQDGSTSQKLELRKDNKTNTITTVQKDNVLTKDEVYWRKLTPLECMRLQTVQDDYLMPVSNTQKYKLLGNGWNIETICHILKNMEV